MQKKHLILLSALCMVLSSHSHAAPKDSKELQGTVKQMINATPKDGEEDVIRVTADADDANDEFADIAAEYGATSGGQVRDPYEKINRAVFGFNRSVDRLFLSPIARGYRKVVPEYGRERVGDFLGNLRTPITFVNSLLQGDVNNSFVSFWRFTLNTTFGIGGLFDVASNWGLKNQPEDFAQTLAKYGTDSGPYLMLPLLGPSTPRAVVGRVGDFFTFPVSYADSTVRAGEIGSSIVHDRSELLPTTDSLERESLDMYSSIKSGYVQYRRGLIENRNISEEQAYD